MSKSPHEGWKPVSELVSSSKAAKNGDLPQLTDMSIFIKSDIDSSTGGMANLDTNKKGSIPDSGATNGQS